ncbi:MAG: hypothetical protein LCH53_07405 [Bacteroidetes bacterium]|nr:hypothetical protein [Bacteroidota bacterium]
MPRTLVHLGLAAVALWLLVTVGGIVLGWLPLHVTYLLQGLVAGLPVPLGLLARWQGYKKTGWAILGAVRLLASGGTLMAWLHPATDVSDYLWWAIPPLCVVAVAGVWAMFRLRRSGWLEAKGLVPAATPDPDEPDPEAAPDAALAGMAAVVPGVAVAGLVAQEVAEHRGD